uniref:Uncharacterized protein n=1 Tax=Erwinia amylovora TaxID=552 RepID=A0A0P0ZHP3_ERWAM|nr:hypothetical protein EAMY692_p20045 [Erwinia amylovora]
MDLTVKCGGIFCGRREVFWINTVLWGALNQSGRVKYGK